MAMIRGTPIAKWVAWIATIAARSEVPDSGVAIEAARTSQPTI